MYSQKQVLKGKYEIISKKMSYELPKYQAELRGVIIDRSTGQTINYATIIVNDSLGVMSNEKGYFSLKIPEGKHKITTKNIGNTTITTKKIKFRESEIIEIYFYLGYIKQFSENL